MVPDLETGELPRQGEATAFAAFSPSSKREYVDWIAEAKRPETRERRITQTVEAIAQGKLRDWKYQE